MSTIEVIIDLPFYLRVEDPLIVRYESICQEAQVPELVGQDVQITFSRRFASPVDKSDWPVTERTTVAIKIETTTQMAKDSVSTFAIRNSLELLNKLILSYYSTTGEISNAGLITLLGTSYMQLFAEIRVDGEDFRDRWPFEGSNTIPLHPEQIAEFKAFLTSKKDWPVRLFLTGAILSLEQGQYSLAVLQAATAVELRMTSYVTSRLKAAGRSTRKITEYENRTLGGKLRFDEPDLRSLETHFGSKTNFSSLHTQLKCWFVPLRNKITHRGCLASHEEAIEAVKVATQFLKIIGPAG